MMNRKLAFLAVCMAVLPAPVYSLGLGDIELRSSLNQPLNAEVELVSATAAELLDLSVELGSSEAFAKANLERSSLLTGLRFEVEQIAGNKGIIRVTSDRPVQEPFLDFLLQVNWQGGQLVREYTVLVDPPILTPSRTPKVAPVTVQATATPVAAPSPVNNTLPAFKAQAIEPIVSTGTGKYNTVDGDTLWGIANRLRPTSKVSTDQMMLALQKKNPSAFLKGNLNQLKVGATLIVPEMEDITSVGAYAASTEVDRQEMVWRGTTSKSASITSKASSSKSGKATVTADKKGTSKENTKQTQPVTKESSVKKADKPVADSGVVAGSKDKPSAKKNPVGVAEKAPKSVSEGRLKLVAPENEDSETLAKQEFGALQQGSKDAQINYLSKELALAVDAAETQRKESDELRSRLADMQTQMQDLQRLITVNETELAQLRSQMAGGVDHSSIEQDQAIAGGEESQEEPASKGLLADILGSPVLKALGAAIATLMLALFWIVSRQRKMQKEVLTDLDEEPGLEQDQTNTVMEATNHQPSQSGDTSDPVAEADVYIAYGRFEQAAELITNAMEQEPGRSDFALKLLEIHYAAKDQTAFDVSAQALWNDIDSKDDPVWEQVVMMGQSLNPDNDLYRDAPAEAAADEVVGDIMSDLTMDDPMPEADDELDTEKEDNTMEWDLDADTTDANELGQDWKPDSEHSVEFEPLATDAVETQTESESDELTQSDALLDEGIQAQDNAGNVGLDETPAVNNELDDVVDEMDTKLDLARAYADMGDAESTLGILEEVLAEGTEQQKQEAEAILAKAS